MEVIIGGRNEVSSERLEVQRQIMRDIFDTQNILMYSLSVLADVPLDAINSFISKNTPNHRSIDMIDMILTQCAAVHGIPTATLDEFIKNYNKND